MPNASNRRFFLLNLLHTHSTRFFVLAALVFGIIICFRLPPLFGNDEIVHFPRAYHVQDGHLWAEYLSGFDYGGQLPKQLVTMNHAFREQVQTKGDASRLSELEKQYRSEKLEGDATEQIAFTSANVYSAWSYAPAAVGVWVADLLHLPLAWYVYLARLSCLAVWLGLVYLAIKYIPAGKYFLIAVALLPTSLVQATTIGMDGLVNGLAWLITALTLAVFAKTLRLTPKIMATFALLSLYLATTKQGYMLIAALPLLIPSHLFETSKKRANIIRIAFAGLLLTVTAAYIARTAPIADTLHFIQRPGLYVDGAAQIKHVLSTPFAILMTIILAPFRLSYGNVYAGVVGVITNKLIYLPVVVICLLYVALLLTFVSQKGNKALSPYRLRLLAGGAGVVAGTFLLINLALYISFTTVGNPHIEGVQGRYLLPLSPLFIFLVSGWTKPRLKLPDNLVGVTVGMILLTGLITAIAVIPG